MISKPRQSAAPLPCVAERSGGGTVLPLSGRAPQQQIEARGVNSAPGCPGSLAVLTLACRGGGVSLPVMFGALGPALSPRLTKAARESHVPRCQMSRHRSQYHCANIRPTCYLPWQPCDSISRSAVSTSVGPRPISRRKRNWNPDSLFSANPETKPAWYSERHH